VEEFMRNLIFGAAGAVVLATSAAAADGDAILKQQCAACHALEKPNAFSVERLWDRKGPDLYYAGAKFNRDWLVEWLQNPTRIRPAGTHYARIVVAGEKADVVDEKKLAPHPKLAKGDAESVADALMTLKGPDGLVAPGAYKGEKANMRLGEMAFTKLRGCSACHRSSADEGGLSGPELHTASRRLKPDYVAEYIKDPQKFDPHVWMPKQEMSDKDIERLTGYLLQLGQGERK
jgi:mono/diheme cytochrome c family protein